MFTVLIDIRLILVFCVDYKYIWYFSSIMKGNNIYSVAISYDSYLEHNSKHRKENNILQSVHNIFELEQGHNFTKD